MWPTFTAASLAAKEKPNQDAPLKVRFFDLLSDSFGITESLYAPPLIDPGLSTLWMADLRCSFTMVRINYKAAIVSALQAKFEQLSTTDLKKPIQSHKNLSDLISSKHKIKGLILACNPIYVWLATELIAEYIKQAVLLSEPLQEQKEYTFRISSLALNEVKERQLVKLLKDPKANARILAGFINQSILELLQERRKRRSSLLKELESLKKSEIIDRRKANNYGVVLTCILLTIAAIMATAALATLFFFTGGGVAFIVLLAGTVLTSAATTGTFVAYDVKSHAKFRLERLEHLRAFTNQLITMPTAITGAGATIEIEKAATPEPLHSNYTESPGTKSPGASSSSTYSATTSTDSSKTSTTPYPSVAKSKKSEFTPAPSSCLSPPEERISPKIQIPDSPTSGSFPNMGFFHTLQPLPPATNPTYMTPSALDLTNHPHNDQNLPPLYLSAIPPAITYSPPPIYSTAPSPSPGEHPQDFQLETTTVLIQV